MASIDQQLLDAWFAGELATPWMFELNASVEFTMDGRTVVGAVISPADAAPDPSFVVELVDGRDVEVRQSLLRRTGSGT